MMICMLQVGPESSGYQLKVSGFSGNHGNAMMLHDGMKFSTIDRDNDMGSSNCGLVYSSGWWFRE